MAFFGYTLVSSLCCAQGPTSPTRGEGNSRWSTFQNRAGWSIQYPSLWRVGSCRSCEDPTDPHVFVTFYDPQTKAIVMIQPLADKPSDQAIESWLHHVAKMNNLNPQVSEEWVLLDAVKALSVVNRHPDSTEYEYIYVVRNSKTFALTTGRNLLPNAVWQRMLSTFRFVTPK